MIVVMGGWPASGGNDTTQVWAGHNLLPNPDPRRCTRCRRIVFEKDKKGAWIVRGRLLKFSNERESGWMKCKWCGEWVPVPVKIAE